MSSITETSMMEKFSLKWNDFQTNVSSSFSKLRSEKDFFDVSLVSDDEVHISSHKLVLSSCSDFFKNMLRKSTHSSPLIYLPGIQAKELNYIMDYIYKGEVQLFKDDLDTFLEVGKKLKVDGLLGDVQTPPHEKDNTSQDLTEESFVMKEEDQTYDKEETEIQNTGTKERRKKKSKKPVQYTVSAQNKDAAGAVDQLVIKNEDKWECKSCGKTAKTSSDMRRHVEIHIEGLSFECQFCGNTFRSRMRLKDHKAQGHCPKSY